MKTLNIISKVVSILVLFACVIFLAILEATAFAYIAYENVPDLILNWKVFSWILLIVTMISATAILAHMVTIADSIKK